MELQKWFHRHIKDAFPFVYQKKLLIAVSGGVDSVVLTHLCRGEGLSFDLAHCNFQLRGEASDGDELFVRELASRLQVQIWVRRFEPAKEVAEGRSIQLVARDLRYRWFDELAAAQGYDYVLTAHHLNDDAETFFINLLRGTGIDGLAGIPAQNENILRPLLHFSGKEIRSYALDNDIQWREDQSNTKDDYLRNRIRHHFVPLFEKENPDFLTSFLLTRNHLQDTVQLLQDYTRRLQEEITFFKESSLYIDIEKLKAQPHPKAVLYQLLKNYGFTAWEDIMHLPDAQPGKLITSEKYRLLKDRAYLIVREKESPEDIIEYTISENENLITFPKGRLLCEKVIKVTQKDKSIAYLASEKLRFPLVLRRWTAGDVFKPFGMKGHKKVSDFLTGAKLSLFEKENTWVLLSGDTVVWVLGQRIHDDFKVEKDTKEILKISFTE